MPCPVREVSYARCESQNPHVVMPLLGCGDDVAEKVVELEVRRFRQTIDTISDIPIHPADARDILCVLLSSTIQVILSILYSYHADFAMVRLDCFTGTRICIWEKPHSIDIFNPPLLDDQLPSENIAFELELRNCVRHRLLIHVS